MLPATIEKLYTEELITEQEYTLLKHQLKQPVSLYADLHILLYLGIILLSTGIGIVIYKNIDNIGHSAIVATIELLCASCFIFCFKKSPGFTKHKQSNTVLVTDYILILGCLLLLTLTGYLQFEYNLFGNQWGLATFVPMILLFLTAYYFDHLGVLSMAITNLAAWAGIAVAPLHIIRDNDLSDPHLIYAAIVLGLGLFAFAWLSEKNNFKAHFSYTYRNFGIHILFIALLAGMFYYERYYLLWLLAISAVVFFIWRYAVANKSFYFFVVTVLYGYISVCHAVFNLLSLSGGIGIFYGYVFWFILSGIALMKLFIHYNKILNRNA